MKDKKEHNERPDPEMVEKLRRLPKEIVERLTKEEVRAFLFGDEWPDSLVEKMKDYIIDEDEKP